MVALSSATLKATGQTTARSIANQSARYINVRGFGALGDGINDDTFAIRSAVNWAGVSLGGNTCKGTVYFPIGTYRVTDTITVTANSTVVCLEGEPGTVITGSVNGYIINYNYSEAAFSGVQHGDVSTLKIVNTHATGGGIRIGTGYGFVVSDCTITANKGIATSIDDSDWCPFEVSLLNIHLDPGDNTSSSVGMILMADGPVSNCTITNYAIGAYAFGGQGAEQLNGCTFRNCTVGFNPGTKPSGGDSVGNFSVVGCRFIDCGTAILTSANASYTYYGGVHIEAASGSYGIRFNGGTMQRGYVAGVNIEGSYSTYGFYFSGGDPNNADNLYVGVGVTNSGGTAWAPVPVTGSTGKILACNVAHVITTVPSGTNLSLGTANAREGDSFNVSNSNTATWGATYATGGSNHVKVRYNGTNWTVVGK